MYQIRDNGDGSKRLLTQSEANAEDVNNAVGAAVAMAALSSGAPFTFVAWLPVALLYGFWVWAHFMSGFFVGLFGFCMGVITLITVLTFGVKLKKPLGAFSGILGLFLLYVFF